MERIISTGSISFYCLSNIIMKTLLMGSFPFKLLFPCQTALPRPKKLRPRGPGNRVSQNCRGGNSVLTPARKKC